MHMGVVECVFADDVNVTYFIPTARDGTSGISQEELTKQIINKVERVMYESGIHIR